VDSIIIEAKKGALLGYDGYKHRWGSKVHVAVTAESLPLSIIVGSGNEHDSRSFFNVVDGIRVGVGRPVCRPGEVYADFAYDSGSIRLYLRRRGVKG